MRMTMMALAVCTLALAVGSVKAEAAENFYKGKQVDFIIPSGVGGGYDSYGRALVRHLGAHFPGNPTIVVQNMPGAGGLRAMNYLYGSAPQDGTVFGSAYNTMTLEPLIGGHGAMFDALKMNWLASMGKLPVTCMTWHTSKTKTLNDALRRVTTVGATGDTGNRATQPKLFNYVLGTRFKVITGYTTSGVLLAVEREEVEGLCGVSYLTIKTVRPDWIAEKKVNFILQFSKNRDPRLGSVPMLTDEVKDPKMLKVLNLLLVMQEIGRPIVAPPNVPQDRLGLLKKAVMDTLKDPEFLTEAERLKLEIDPIYSTEINSLLQNAYASPKEVVSIAAKILARPKKAER